MKHGIVVKTLFDKYGRRIPKGLQSNVCDADRDFWLNQPELNEEVDFANRITRLHECLGVDTKVTGEQFKAKTEGLMALIRDNSQIANIANGVWLPVVLPRFNKFKTDDLGTTLWKYMKAVSKSYAKDFSDRKFVNHHYKKSLVKKISIVDGSRHDQLIERMKQTPVIGIYFPNPLQGFSINADREQMSDLPEGFILSGMDIPIAMIMYPDILAHGIDTPNLDMSALDLVPFAFQVDNSLDFWASNIQLNFDNTDTLANAYDNFSGGLLFLG